MRVLIKAKAGSHLFGTNTETSDQDFKGVYIPSADEILLGDYPDTVRQSTGDGLTKNTREDTDVELYSLRKFFKMLKAGDTAALELLFTPESMILEKHPSWDYLLTHREAFLSKKITAIIGYARQQANKYGIKGSRMGELSKCINILKTLQKEFDFEGSKLKHNWETITKALSDLEHVHIVTLPAKKNEEPEIPALDILGRKFDWHCTFTHILQILTTIYKNYGHRARQAKNNNGVDWKALSHAVRVSYQGIELLSTGKITLPLPEDTKKIVMDIKLGNKHYKEVSILIEELLTKIETLKDSSSLKEDVDYIQMEHFIKVLHASRVTEDLIRVLNKPII